MTTTTSRVRRCHRSSTDVPSTPSTRRHSRPSASPQHGVDAATPVCTRPWVAGYPVAETAAEAGGAAAAAWQEAAGLASPLRVIMTKRSGWTAALVQASPVTTGQPTLEKRAMMKVTFSMVRVHSSHRHFYCLTRRSRSLAQPYRGSSRREEPQAVPWPPPVELY